MTIHNYTEITVTGFNLIRLMFGRKIKLYTDIEVDKDVEVISTTQNMAIEPILPEKHQGCVELSATQLGQ